MAYKGWLLSFFFLFPSSTAFLRFRALRCSPFPALFRTCSSNFTQPNDYAPHDNLSLLLAVEVSLCCPSPSGLAVLGHQVMAKSLLFAAPDPAKDHCFLCSLVALFPPPKAFVREGHITDAAQ